MAIIIIIALLTVPQIILEYPSLCFWQTNRMLRLPFSASLESPFPFVDIQSQHSGLKRVSIGP